MKFLLFGILLFFFSLTYASWCDSSNASKDPTKVGSIVYGVADRKCAPDKGQLHSCFEQIEKDSNYCKSNNILVQYYCDKKMPSRREIVCPNDGVCSQGRCHRR